ncbi:TPA: acyltransferase [Escherichia coli]|nr:acyltransferase [Escherichia coli]
MQINPSSKNKLDAIQFFRCAAIMFVVYAHSFDRIERYVDLGHYNFLSDLAHFARSGVDMFFIISGFIMSYITHADIYNNKFSWGTFMYKRITRIAPMYWLVTLAVLILLKVAPALFYNTTTNLAHTVGSFLFVPVASPEGKFAPLLGVGWTLNLEVYFYLTLSLVIIIFREKYLTSFFVLLLLSVSAGYLFGHRENLYLYSLITNPILFEFFMGIMVYHIYSSVRQSNNDFRWYVAFIISILVLVLTIFYRLPDDMRFIYWGGSYAVLILSTLVLFSSCNFLRILIKIGDASYTIYLTHYFVISGFYYALTKSGYDFSQWLMLSVLTAMSLSAFFGYFAYRLIEMNITAVFKKYVPKGV